MFLDDRGLKLTTKTPTAAAAYNRAIRQYFEYRLAAGKSAKEVLAQDPDFVMGHCLRGYLFMLFGTTAVYDTARGHLEAAEARLDGVTPREKAHVTALRSWLTGNMRATNAIWDEILVEEPHDLLALRLQHFSTFWMGNAQELRNAPARVLEAWDESVPGHGYVLGMLAFGLEECGEYAEAERYGRRAADVNPDDLWAVHAVAHVLEMQGRLEDGLAWMNQPDDAWEDRNPFRGHLWWHTALFPFELGRYDQVLAIYDRAIRTEKSDFYLDIQNQASLLYRLEFQGVELGDRWQELADLLQGRLEDHVMAFTDVHTMMALAAADRQELAGRLMTSLRAFSWTPDNTAAATMEKATIPLCEAILAYRRGDWSRAITLLLETRHDLAPIGGSHAQRDIFHQILLEATIKARRFDLARALLSERVSLKPRSKSNWTKYAEVLEALGETDKAENARAEARLLAS